MIAQPSATGIRVSAGKAIRLYLVDGTPGGLITAEIINWTGHAVAAARSELSVLMGRPEAQRTGTYILLGDDPDSLGGELAYIGEGDNVGKRLYQHSRPEDQNGKDFWTRAIVPTSSDANLTKAHARYLESRLIELAVRASRAKVLNSTNPTPIALPEADVASMEYYLEQAKIVLPILGVNILRSASTGPRPGGPDQGSAHAHQSPVFVLTQKRDGVSATAQEFDGEFTVLAGSTARSQWVGVQESGYSQLRAKIVSDGTLTASPDGTTMQFVRDQAFASPSAAAAVVLGRSANGRIEWFVKGTRTTFGDWQSEPVKISAA